MDASKVDSQGVLLRRQALVFPPTGQAPLATRVLEGFELELAELGYVPSTRLRARLETVPPEQVGEFKKWLCETLASALGADQKHRPLFRKFPLGIPEDTHELWWRRVLVHFLQRPDQQCIFCLGVGTTHVLNPCEHVICDHCFDGSNYSACPVCNRQVDRFSPFFLPSPERPLPKEQVRFKVLDLGDGLEVACRDLFQSFCARTQPMSPADRADFEVLVRDHADGVLDWLPDRIPVKENIAIIFGTLFQICTPGKLLEAARPYLNTATDVLRVLATYSGADPALQGETVLKKVVVGQYDPWWSAIERILLRRDPGPHYWHAQKAVKVNRFKLGRLSRPLRRTLLALLEGLDPDRLAEDMLRHRSYWVWIGEFLHPHEYASRFPNVNRAFKIVRKKSPAGEAAPPFQTFPGKVEAAISAGELAEAIRLLHERPGELGRRLDHLLRLAGDDTRALDALVAACEGVVGDLPTPMLLTLRNHFPTRTAVAPVRVYWPKGGTAGGISAPDERAPLQAETIRRIVGPVEATLLARFRELPEAPTWLIDRNLENIVVPFNERTASPGAVSLPRGSTIHAPLPPGKFVRLFLHWCEPTNADFPTDIDLSVGFYSGNWEYKGVCSYYELQCRMGNKTIAKSAGDLTSAPPPDGASEFVDIDWTAAIDFNIRYAVMVVNAYSGMAFSQLERAFAGYMVRADRDARHFDARTVEMKFDLQGERGIFVPVVFDFVEERLHWLDVYSRGMPALNNVETSNRAIQRICPDLIAYFASGVRMSMYELALLHAAARAREVFLRGESTQRFERTPGESDMAFLKRLQSGSGTRGDLSQLANKRNLTGVLLRGDLELAPDSHRYVIFPETITGTMSASDFLS